MLTIAEKQVRNLENFGPLVPEVSYNNSYSACLCECCGSEVPRGTKESIVITVLDNSGIVIDDEGIFGPYCINCLNKMRFLISQVDK